MIKKRKNGYWTLEKCKSDALKFNTRTEWALNSPSGYGTAIRKKWLSKCCKHMKQGRKPDDYWNYDRCKKDALKFKTKGEWRKKSVGAATSALKHGWYEELTYHMLSPIKPMYYWTKERCIEEAKKYKDKDEWVKNNSSSYNSANKYGWMKECSKHMPVKKREAGYWTLERCLESTRFFKKKTDWKNSFKGAVNAARKNGWYKKCISNFPKKTILTKELCVKEFKKYKNRADWMKLGSYSYSVARRKGWLKDKEFNMEPLKRPANFWIKEKCLESAKSCTNLQEWIDKFPGAVNSASKNGWYKMCVNKFKK